MPKTLLDTPLETCCAQPVTGFVRDGYCRAHTQDAGKHIVCARVTDAFLAFSSAQGNDLVTPRSEYGFPRTQSWRLLVFVCCVLARSACGWSGAADQP